VIYEDRSDRIPLDLDLRRSAGLWPCKPVILSDRPSMKLRGIIGGIAGFWELAAVAERAAIKASVYRGKLPIYFPVGTEPFAACSMRGNGARLRDVNRMASLNSGPHYFLLGDATISPAN
jgi:hypothetical protein